MADADMKAMGWLILGLFAIMLIVAVFYIGQTELNEVICENDGPDYMYQNAVCYNDSTSGTVVTVTAITKVNTVVALADIVLGLLALVIVVKLFKVILRVGKSFSDD